MASIIFLASVREARRQGRTAPTLPDLSGDMAHAADELLDLIVRLDMRGEGSRPLMEAVDWLRARAAGPAPES
ncbi:hypothetical protein [Azospirillum sp. TSO22-1]|uniref:hypothetical protein n=1 Tax=Azospirillum sp. TSO22-1 TaxID=716789 RepID=UPI000D60D1B5|nr:hypothetical protein [Azospirillum sp. TSO22-1]PWC41689.1 hypothetical protein TSO221_23065 [Azospirillum sp. TSO22-1]